MNYLLSYVYSSAPKKKFLLKKDTGINPIHTFHKQKDISSIDLRPKCPPVYDQGHLGSCTANAIAAAYQFDSPKFLPSRLFLYYGEREIEEDVSDDKGASLESGIKFLTNTGVCSEKDWPYDITKFAVCPPQVCYEDAAQHQCKSARKINQSLEQLKSALISGYPVIFGMVVYESFEKTTSTGLVSMPKEGEKVLGGHAVLLVGFDDEKQLFTVRNSWGSSWGDKGYFYLPYDYVINPDLTHDFWVINLVTDNSIEALQEEINSLKDQLNSANHLVSYLDSEKNRIYDLLKSKEEDFLSEWTKMHEELQDIIIEKNSLFHKYTTEIIALKTECENLKLTQNCDNYEKEWIIEDLKAELEELRKKVL